MTDRVSPPMMERPEGKQVLGASLEPLNDLEKAALSELDPDKLNYNNLYFFTIKRFS